MVPTLLLPLLAACAQAEPAAPAPERDPAVEQALADQIMVDPDLANENEGNAALTVAVDHSLPMLVAIPEAIAAARADASVLVKGADHLVRPDLPRIEPIDDARFTTPAQFAAALPGVRDCAEAMTYSAAWAARLPATLPVYPRGATLEAAGTDADGCSLRVASFVTPVEPADVMAFYLARARQSGFTFERAESRFAHGLAGKRGGAAFRLSIAIDPDRMTQVTLATTGL
jgi:hypothetical protein